MTTYKVQRMYRGKAVAEKIGTREEVLAWVSEHMSTDASYALPKIAYNLSSNFLERRSGAERRRFNRRSPQRTDRRDHEFDRRGPDRRAP